MNDSDTIADAPPATHPSSEPCAPSTSDVKSDPTNPPVKEFADVEQFGEGLAAGCRLLHARYHLPVEAVVLIHAAVTATALGPSARVRNPWNTDLPLSLEITFCAAPQSILPAALANAFHFFRMSVSEKLRWRDAAGSRRLRADFLAALHALEPLEAQLLQADPSFQRPPSFPKPILTDEELHAHVTLERQRQLAHRDELRAELALRRMDLLPFIVGEDPGWDSLLHLDALAFDRCFTALSPTGASIRELCASSSKTLGKLARLLQASRRGGDLTDGASLLLQPMLVLLHVVSPELLTAALRHPGVRAGGFLDGLILDLPGEAPRLEASAFAQNEDDEIYHEWLIQLFIQRARGVPRLYMLGRAGFEAMENFRQVTQRIPCEDQNEQGGFPADLSAQVLKLALCLHLAAGNEEIETIDVAAVEYAAKLVRRVAIRQPKLLARLVPVRTPAQAMADAVTRMVAKLSSLGGGATVRELFRTYSGQDYDALTPVLDQAAQQGVILSEGRNLRLPPVAPLAVDNASSVSTRQP